MPATHDQEELLNGKLAELLREQGLDARAERREGGRRMDVVVDVQGARVVLEAETGVSAAKRKEAVGDADRRLKQGLTTLVLALCYPSDSTTDSLPDAKMIWAVRTRSERRRPARWSEPGDVPELAEAVRQAAATVGDADGAAQILSEALDAAVQRFSTVTRKQIAKALDLRAENAKDRKLLAPHQRDTDGYFVATKRGMLVVATAMLFHHRLQEHLPPLHPGGYEGAWPPLNPSQCAAEPESTIRDFLEAWRAILAVDYRPVFETARVALMALPHTRDTAQAVFTLAGEVAKIAGLMHGLRHDLLGRIFHRVLDTAKYDGSFYTSAAAATLLAGLAIREDGHDWSSADAIAQLHICDPACGTGTLLIAAAARIEVLRRQAGPIDADDEEALALCLVEDVLWGYDINLTATHIAASTLGMLSPSTRFGRMNVHRTLLGVYQGNPYLGSLEFLTGQPRLAAWPSLSRQVDDDTTGETPEPPPKMDLIIMNPPFTRDSLRHDQFSRDDELLIKASEKDTLDGQPYRAAARLHSSGGMFAVLGERMLKSDIGTLALVLPTVVPTAPGNLELRKYLAGRFYVDTIVSSHDPERINMSENTNIGEVLIVCRRHPNGEPKPPTRIVNLTENPPTPLAAGAIRAQITAGDGPFVIQYTDADQIANGDWYAVNFLSPFLVNEARKLRDDAADAHQRFVKMSEIAKIGPEGRRIRDAYKRHDKPTASGRRALWYHKTDVTQAMHASTDSYIEPKPDKEGLAKKYWKQRSKLLLAHRLWLPLARVCAVRLDERTVGSLWTPCRPHDDDPATQAALCAYLNSSIGLLAILGGRDNRKPSYPQFSLDTLRSIPVPNFPALGDDARDALADAYEALKNEVLLPFPQMDEDPIRKQLDATVANALNLDPEWVAQIRCALSEEPSITNKRYAGSSP